MGKPTARQASQAQSMSGPGTRNLRRWNLAMAALHFTQGVLMLLISSDFTLPVTSSFLQLNPDTNGLEPVMDTLFDLRLGPLIASFLFVSCIAHLTVSAPGVYQWYLANLSRGVNYARWAEYSVSASIMMVLIAMLVGIYEVTALLLIFSANAAMIFFGWVMERVNQGREEKDWSAFVFGSIIGLMPWVAITIYLAGSGGENGDVPGFVYGIFFSIFVTFNVFAINMYLQYKAIGPWRNYVFGEFVYILLSLTAKSLLAWQVYAGTLQPS